MENNWQNHYQPPVQSIWQGRPDSLENERFFQIVQCKDLREPIEGNSYTFAILGFACEAGVRRNMGDLGAKEGPSQLRKTLGNYAYHLSSQIKLYDVGNIVCDGDDLEAAQQSLGEAVALLLKNNCHPIVIGGGHEVAWGHYQGIAKAYPELNLGIINFDAHYDLRPILENNKGTSGTPFLQIANDRLDKGLSFSYACVGIQPDANAASLYDTASRLDVTTIPASAINDNNLEEVIDILTQIVEQHDAIYLSLCLDVFAAHVAPGVSAPQTLGLLPQTVQLLIKKIVDSHKVISFDIAELAPALDYNNQTAKLTSSMLIHYLNNAK